MFAATTAEGSDSRLYSSVTANEFELSNACPLLHGWNSPLAGEMLTMRTQSAAAAEMGKSKTSPIAEARKIRTLELMRASSFRTDERTIRLRVTR